MEREKRTDFDFLEDEEEQSEERVELGESDILADPSEDHEVEAV